MSRLDLVVGPNGAGKSTYVRLVLAGAAPMSAIVNADDISKQNWPEDAEAHSYDAAEIAAATRERLIDLRQPLIAETVFSHASKLELIHRAQAADYFVALHVLLVPNRSRRRARRRSGRSRGPQYPRGRVRRAIRTALAARGCGHQHG